MVGPILSLLNMYVRGWERHQSVKQQPDKHEHLSLEPRTHKYIRDNRTHVWSLWGLGQWETVMRNDLYACRWHMYACAPTHQRKQTLVITVLGRRGLALPPRSGGTGAASQTADTHSIFSISGSTHGHQGVWVQSVPSDPEAEHKKGKPT